MILIMLSLLFGGIMGILVGFISFPPKENSDKECKTYNNIYKLATKFYYLPIIFATPSGFWISFMTFGITCILNPELIHFIKVNIGIIMCCICLYIIAQSTMYRLIRHIYDNIYK